MSINLAHLLDVFAMYDEDYSQLQDGMQNTWDIDILNEVIGDYLIEYPVDSVCPFHALAHD